MIVTPQEMNVPEKIGDFVVNSATWEDFPGAVPGNTWFLAYTYWNIKYNIFGVKGKGFHVKVVCTIFKKSWHIKEKVSKRLLRHQYGHYLIGCLSALAFRREANEVGRKMRELEDYKKYCGKLLKETVNKCIQDQKKYDKDTNHSIKSKEQGEWERHISRQFQQFSKEESKKGQEDARRLITAHQRYKSEKKQLPILRKVSAIKPSTGKKTRSVFKVKTAIDRVINEYSLKKVKHL